jgi:PTH1 family peptidyl-tRNA hydrolase
VPATLKLVVGLGNPGQDYTETRHNAGFWFVDEFVLGHSFSFSEEKKFFGQTARIGGSVDCRVLKPDTFMNQSGRSVKSLMDYFNISPSELMVAHDEIDLCAGTIRLKQGGGHGGHNGLRDIISQIGTADFLRMRIGVGHPGKKDDVVDYVLHRPGQEERRLIDESIVRGLDIMPLVFNGELNKAMTLLNVKG